MFVFFPGLENSGNSLEDYILHIRILAALGCWTHGIIVLYATLSIANL